MAIVPRNAPEISRRASSPARWPCRSLKSLKRSTLISSTESGEPVRLRSANRRCSSSSRARRLTRPVSGSVRACADLRFQLPGLALQFAGIVFQVIVMGLDQQGVWPTAAPARCR